MTIKIVLAAAVLVLSPTIAMAACASHSQSASQCTQGQVWNAEMQKCVATSS
ncbi:hypothetical protein [Chelativorans salis]|uniref:Adenylosuccinate lyase n=1 Tax=Chelativorans salis TaxID=2978478 RepID=A0ABT2LTT3_9HYPH|nr:hypothetical protein [Chelativorans sp. EGI FJ00035]MCT7377946.1 hypothetical protein [Chelativorans sp. EGI FJ00035]